MKGTNISHYFIISSTSISSSILSIFISVTSGMSSSLTSRCHSSSPRPHPHSVPKHEVVVTPELEIGLFRQP
jgi:hypothetical protein